jgi:DNA mismatch repair protein MutS
MLQAIGCRTLFATHYHELTALRHPRLRDLSMAVQEREGEVVFLKRVVDGPATGSYGIHVAGIAGIPKAVLLRAQELREQLEAQERSLPAELGGAGPRAPAPPAERQPDQNSLFSAEELVLEELRGMDIDRLSPLDALNRLAALQKSIKQGKRRS